MVIHSRSALVAFVLGFVGTSCADERSTGQQLAPVPGYCAQPARITPDLRSFRGTIPASFSTDGSEFLVLVSDFEHGGFFDPDVGRSAVYFGPTSAPPSWDRQRNVVSNVVLQLTATEVVPMRVNLPAGRYWIWVSNFPDLKLVGCTPGAVTDVSVAS